MATNTSGPIAQHQDEAAWLEARRTGLGGSDIAWIILAVVAGAAVGYDQGVRTGHREAIEAVRETLETIEADIGRAWRALDSMYTPPHLVMEADDGDR